MVSVVYEFQKPKNSYFFTKVMSSTNKTFKGTETSDNSLIDDYYWLKTPGESDDDGCTNILPDGNACPKFDSFCESQGSIGSQSTEHHQQDNGGIIKSNN